MSGPDPLRETVLYHADVGGAMPTASPSRPPDIEAGEKGRWQSYVLLSCQLQQVWLHWMGNRSLPCLRKQGTCPTELHTHPLIWRAYACAMAYAEGMPDRPAVLSLTQPALLRCPKVLQWHDDADLRGRCIRLCRAHAGRTMPQRVEVISDEPAQVVLPEPIDLDQYLWTLWRSDSRLLAWAASLQSQPRREDRDADKF